MPEHIDDKVLDVFAVIGTHTEIAEKLRRRFGDVATSCEFSIVVRNQAEHDLLAQIVKDIEPHPSDTLRRRLCSDNPKSTSPELCTRIGP
jgi:hypothetical protein